MIIAILGATGLTGNICLHYLLNDPKITQVIAIGRRNTGVIHSKLTEIILFHNVLIEQVYADALINCLGTTIKKAGSEKAFQSIDFELPVSIARELFKQGCTCAATISAVGADVSSSFLYTRTKGRLEAQMQDIGFESLSIIRPSFILGSRSEKRAGEIFALTILKLVSPLLLGPLSRYKPMDAADIAKALLLSVLQCKPGKRIFYYSNIRKLLKKEAFPK